MAEVEPIETAEGKDVGRLPEASEARTRIGPVDAPARFESIDVLRGFALLGILMMNISTFALPGASRLVPTIAGGFSGANYAEWWLGYLSSTTR